MINFVLKTTPHYLYPDENENTSLHLAVRFGNEQKIKENLAAMTGRNLRDKDGFTAFHYATERGNGDIVAAFLADGGTDPNCQTPSGCTAYHLAINRVIRHRDPRFLTRFDVSTVNPNISDNEGKTPFHYALPYYESFPDMLATLITHQNFDLNLPDSKGNSPIHYLVKTNNLDLFLPLLQKPNIDVNQRDSNGNTALHHAAYNKNWDVVTHLTRRQDLDPNITNRHGYTAYEMIDGFSTEGKLALQELRQHPKYKYPND
jgi:ankyrin repeat protein